MTGLYRGEILDSKNLSYRLGHRQRTKQKYLDAQATESEMLELLLMYSIPRCDVKPLARELEKKYGGVSKIISAPYEDLIKNVGVKQNTAILLKLVYDLMMTGYRHELRDAPVFHNYQRLCDYCKYLLNDKKVEELHILYLDGDHKLLEDETHSVGTINWSAVYPREILKRALNWNASSIVMLHNHPISGLSFSNDDISITQEVINTLAGVGIGFFDHLLVSGGIIYSMKNSQLLK